MGQSTGHAGAAIFAAEGSGRNRAVRIAVAGGMALLAAWLIALALGVLGGFQALPGLPGAHSSPSREASSPTRHAVAHARMPLTAAPARVRTVAPSPSGYTRPTSSAGSTPKPASRTATPPSTTSQSSTSLSTNGKSATAHATRTTGKPVGSPGSAAGGSGAPGHLR